MLLRQLLGLRCVSNVKRFTPRLQYLVRIPKNKLLTSFNYHNKPLGTYRLFNGTTNQTSPSAIKLLLSGRTERRRATNSGDLKKKPYTRRVGRWDSGPSRNRDIRHEEYTIKGRAYDGVSRLARDTYRQTRDRRWWPCTRQTQKGNTTHLVVGDMIVRWTRARAECGLNRSYGNQSMVDGRFAERVQCENTIGRWRSTDWQADGRSTQNANTGVKSESRSPVRGRNFFFLTKRRLETVGRCIQRETWRVVAVWCGFFSFSFFSKQLKVKWRARGGGTTGLTYNGYRSTLQHYRKPAGAHIIPVDSCFETTAKKK